MKMNSAETGAGALRMDRHARQRGPRDLGLRKHRGEPRLQVRTDTLTGTLHCAGERVVEGRHFKADLTISYGRVIHDYLT